MSKTAPKVETGSKREKTKGRDINQITPQCLWKCIWFGIAKVCQFWHNLIDAEYKSEKFWATLSNSKTWSFGPFIKVSGEVSFRNISLIENVGQELAFVHHFSVIQVINNLNPPLTYAVCH